MCCRCDNRAVTNILASRHSRSSPLMHLLRCLFFSLNGISSARVTTDVPSSKKSRLPITTPIMRKLYAALSQHPPSHDRVMLWAACSLCFFGFFRAGEITVPSQSGFDRARYLAWSDVSVDSRIHPSVLQIHLKVFKCDQFGRGVAVYVGRTNDQLCPVAAGLAYMACGVSTPGPFFRFGDGSLLTKKLFILRVRELLSAAGLDPSLYSGHSFCIGGATSEAQAGLEDSTIRALGRWSSVAFLVYIRMSRTHLAGYSHKH